MASYREMLEAQRLEEDDDPLAFALGELKQFDKIDLEGVMEIIEITETIEVIGIDEIEDTA